MLIRILTLLVISPVLAFANGVGNGGDICENRFTIVRNDIQSWILKGGSVGLNLPEGVSFENYNQSMLFSVETAKVSCTDEKLFVGNAEKTCLNDRTTDGLLLIRCNSNRFLNTSESDQYVLVHHEFAGLSGLEVNTGEASDYRLSNQISGFLQNQLIKKLVVKPPVVTEKCSGLKTADPIGLFNPGQLILNLENTKANWESRVCNNLTGCSDWKVEGDHFAGVQYSGSSKISIVNGNSILMNFFGAVRNNEKTDVFHCSLERSGKIDCELKNYLAATGFIKMTGEFREGCYFIAGSAVFDIPNGIYNEYRVAIVGHY